MSPGATQVIEYFDAIRVWQQGDRRAVHKPLLVLLMLGRLAQGQEAARFDEIEDELGKLLQRFGPGSAMSSRHYPFWHLRSDGVWDLRGPANILNRPAGATPTLTEMRGISGAFSQDVLYALRSNPELIPRIAQRIVAGHFPESLQQDVLDSVGLPGDGDGTESAEEHARRDPRFRARVLLAYEHRCCVCRHDLRLGGQVVGLEAAHIRWFQAQGPDIEPNGLSLCSLHHKLFDLGVFTVLPDQYVLVVSQHVTGSDDVRDRLMSYHGAGIVLPQSKSSYPAAEYLAWHHGEVFKSPQREV